MKGSGDFVFYVNNKKVKSVAFDEQHTIKMAKLDFSKDLYNEFKLKYPDSCAAGEDVSIKFAIENYKPNKNGDGFALSYVFSAEFKNSEIADSDKAPIHLLISKKAS